MGKTSIAQAINFALRGLPERVKLKKDYGELVHDEADEAGIYVDTGEQQIAVTIRKKDGKTTGQPKPENISEFIACALDPFFFTDILDDAGRRKLLFKLSGTKAGKDTVFELLQKGGANMDKAKKLENVLMAGFDQSAKTAADHASDARKEWERLACEKYGSDKAGSFSVVVPDLAPVDIDALRNQKAAALNGITSITQQISAYQGAKGQREALEKNLQSGVPEGAELVSTLRDKDAQHKSSIAAMDSKLQDLNSRLMTMRNEARQEMECPGCHATLKVHNGTLVLAAERAANYEGKIAFVEKQIELGKRQLEGERTESAKAVKQLRDIEVYTAMRQKLDDMPVIAPLDLDQLNSEKTTLSATLENINTQINQYAEAHRAMEESGKINARLQTLHQDVSEWARLKDLLSPEGVPSIIMGSALGPINVCLQEQARASSWPVVEVDSNMVVTYGGRSYGLLSKSEKWQAAAMLAVTISYLSGVKFILLDEADILDIPGRSKLYKWAMTLKEKNVQGVICMTLKEAPREGFDGVSIVWLQ